MLRLFKSVAALGAIGAVIAQVSYVPCARNLQFTQTVTESVSPANYGNPNNQGIISATFTPAGGQPYLVHHVQFHVSKNCNASMAADSTYDGPNLATTPIGTSNGLCTFPWFQGPFDLHQGQTAYVPQNVIAYTSNSGSSSGASYDQSTNTYSFMVFDNALNLVPGDLICYDFTYDFYYQNSGSQTEAQCNTGICNINGSPTGPGTPPPTQASSIGTQPPSVRGDPQFTGFQGQEFQVHGVAGNIYNVFSNENLQLNSQFVFLTEGVCDKSLDTLCFGHAGSYIGAVGIEFKGEANANATRILIQSGRHDQGLTVKVNDRILPVSAKSINQNGIIIRRTHQSKIHIHSPQLAVSITNSDRFLNLDMDLSDEFLSEEAIHSCEWPASAEYDEPHGLMGQTWCLREMKSSKVEGEIEDYSVTDGMFGKKFLYNKF